MGEVLSFIGLKASNLGKQGAVQAETVASLAVLLDQRRPDLPSFYSALTSSENEDDEAKVRLAECRRRLDTLDAGIHQANTTRTRLARVLRDLQDARELEIPRTEEKKASVPNLTKKGQEYSDKVRRMEVRSCLFVCCSAPWVHCLRVISNF